MSKIWRSSQIPNSLKLRIFESTCIPILLYGCEAWTLTKALEKCIDVFATSCYRVMLNIQKIEHIKNNELFKILNRKPLHLTVLRRQLNFLG